MTSQSPSNESSKESLDQPVDGLIRKPYTTSSKQSILTEFVDNYDSVSGIRSSTVLKKSKQASDSFSVDEEKNIKPCKRWRKRKDSVVDEVRPATEVMRPFKKLKIEMRKRRRAKTSEDEGGPTIAKQRMTKISEYRSLKLRHTLARRGIETERMLHETVLRAVALMAVQGPNTPVTYRKSAKRQARDYSSSNSSDVQPSKPSSVKKSRPARIFDVANFEWVLEMSLRRPRAFVGLYKTMKCQYRVLEKRRWVEKNRRFYDRAQFEKFLKETSHNEVELIENTKLLKAERDMELVLGVKRAKAQRTKKFAAKDLIHWYGMSTRYAEQADALFRKTLEEAEMLDVALGRLRKQEAEVGKDRQKATDRSIWNSVSAALKFVVQMIEASDHNEIKEHMEVVAVQNNMMNMITHIERRPDGIQDHLTGEVPKPMLPELSELHPEASETAAIVSIPVENDVQVEALDDEVERENAFIACVNLLDKEMSTASDYRIPSIIHMQSHLPFMSAHLSTVLKMNIFIKLQLPFESRFTRPRHVDRELDLLPPGTFSPYSTDEEWEEFYEKKEHFESHHPMMRKLSWSSYGCDEDVNDKCVSDPVGHRHCDCAVALDCAKEWVSGLRITFARRCYSEEVLPTCSNRSVTTHHEPIRPHSALSCLSLEQIPILDAPTSAVVPTKCDPEHGDLRRTSSSPPALFSEPCSSSDKCPTSVSASWKPADCWLHRDFSSPTLCESRRDRYMYPRALSGCRQRVYATEELIAVDPRRHRRRGNCESDIPERWIKRDEQHRHDFLKPVRSWLEDRAQRSIPVLWCTRPDRSTTRFSQIEGFDMDGGEQDSQMMSVFAERRDCSLEYPIAVYNPPPTWKMLTQSQCDECKKHSSDRLEHSSEPSAFQPVLQRPQPINLNAIEVQLETDDESDNKLPRWPLLKKLREAERELLAAGNPLAIERQKIREYNRHLRSEILQERDVLEEQLRHLRQLYMEYFGTQQLVQEFNGSNQTGERGQNDKSKHEITLFPEAVPVGCSKEETFTEVFHVDPHRDVCEERCLSSTVGINNDVLMRVQDKFECTAEPETVISCGDDETYPNVEMEHASSESAVVNASSSATLLSSNIAISSYCHCEAKTPFDNGNSFSSPEL